MIVRRTEFLAAYQDDALANKYARLVARVRDAESSISSAASTRLAEAVARAYFKTLAYKDEYEVARLHTRPEFLNGLRDEYGNNARIRFHLAPPLISTGTDSRGRPRKREFGTWIIPLFRLLARLRSLRGTKLDVFGMTRERKMERALIGEFETQVSQIINCLTAENYGLAVEIVNEYLEIRGYGPVKEKAAEESRARIETKLAGFLQVFQRAA
jgi:indolepyruvate ferredoxin oxidoreductase